MLIKAKELKGYSLKSLDGDIGSVNEFYFDDQYWTVRYLIASTANWLSGRTVLISPYSLGDVNRGAEEMSVRLTRKQVENSPSIDTHEPVSRQYEGQYNGYYGYPNYWGGPYAWGVYPYIERDRAKWSLSASKKTGTDRHLRSTEEVTGYYLHALDGEIGHVDDFIIDDETWAIRYLIVDTHNWWPGKKVLISPQWIERVSWDERKVFVNLSRLTIKASPEYTADSLLTRDYEISLHGHFNRKGYWVDELVNS